MLLVPQKLIFTSLSQPSSHLMLRKNVRLRLSAAEGRKTSFKTSICDTQKRYYINRKQQQPFVAIFFKHTT
jgi:hypothetical protein